MDFDLLATSAGPAVARGRAVLGRTWNLSIQHPDGGHVTFEAGLTIHGHGVLEEEDFVCASKTICGSISACNAEKKFIDLRYATDPGRT